MTALPADWGALCGLVFLLGLRHGFDADHLATIDGLTRLNARAGRRFARYCGTLFSLGHGLIVLLIAVSVAAGAGRWRAGDGPSVPAWLDGVGDALAIAVLLALGVLNIRAVLSAPPGAVVAPAGLKGRLLGSLTWARRPWSVAVVGALFALSFDTVSQALLFALTAREFGGLTRALALSGLFATGMIATDALNGLWISRLIARADQLASVASRVMSVAVAGVSLLIAGLAAARHTVDWMAAWIDHRELAASIVVCLVMAGAYACARWLSRTAMVTPSLPS